MSDNKDYTRERLRDGSQVLFRPVIAAWFTDNEVSLDAFKLSSADKKDSNRLSVSREAAATSREAYESRAKAIKERCEQAGREYRPPVGVYQVTVSDTAAVEVVDTPDAESRNPLTVWDDSMNEHIPDEHGHIDYNDIPPTNRGLHEYVAKALLERARENGWAYRPN